MTTTRDQQPKYYQIQRKDDCERPSFAGATDAIFDGASLMKEDGKTRNWQENGRELPFSSSNPHYILMEMLKIL